MISIHTPARGVTVKDRGIDYVGYNFNPHSREGSDYHKKSETFYESDFNPHSREGSDAEPFGEFSGLRNFNPHSREGSDYFAYYASPHDSEFQSTLPRGE